MVRKMHRGKIMKGRGIKGVNLKANPGAFCLQIPSTATKFKKSSSINVIDDNLNVCFQQTWRNCTTLNQALDVKNRVT